MPDCYGYIRVSTGDQADGGVSLPAQQEIIQQEYWKLHAKTPFDSFRVFCDAGVSAFTKNLKARPEGSQLIASCKPEDCVIITRLDRAFRNAGDGHQTLAWFQKQRIRVIILDLPGGGQADTATAAGFMTIAGSLMFAQFSSIVASERIHVANKYNLRTRGWATNPLPGHSSKMVKGKPVQYVEHAHIETAKRFLSTYWKEGPEGVRGMLNRNEITFEKRYATGLVDRLSPLTEFRNKITIAVSKSLLTLYCTHNLKAFAAECGVDIDYYFNPRKSQMRSPLTGGWIKIGIPKGCEDYDIVPRVAS